MASAAPFAPAITFEQVQRELQSLLECREIRNSLQLRKLLQFLVTETLEGRADALKEYNVGLTVFQRGTDFDPRLDSIVRVQASILRKKLEAHYAALGETLEPGMVTIRIPRGSYVPEWMHVPPVPGNSEPSARIESPPKTEPWISSSPWRAALLGALAGLIVASAGWWWLWRGSQPQSAVAKPAAPALSILGAFLAPGTPTVVSFGVPLFFTGGAGLFVRDVQVNTLADSPAKIEKMASAVQKSFRPQEDVYTGIGEAVGIQVMSQYLERRGVPVSVANSHYLGPPDLLGKNLVVISSMRFQTLLDSLRLPHAFEFNAEAGELRNTRPLAGEPQRFEARYGDAKLPDVSFARITVWPSSSPGTRILYLSGRETWATQASVQYLVDAAEQKDLQARLDADPPQGPRGAKGPYLEVLLRVEGRNNRFQQCVYVTHRYLEVALPLRFR